MNMPIDGDNISFVDLMKALAAMTRPNGNTNG